MRQGLLNGAIFQVAALITSVIIVHMAYVAVIRPNAEIVAQQQEYLQQTDPDYTPERSFYVVLRDFEQETCIILFLWATAIIGLKAKQTLGDRKLLDRNLLQVTEGTSILPQDARNFARPLQALSDDERVTLLPRALIAGLHRFQSTQNIQDVSTTVKDVCESEADRMETELAIVRYIAWAIPSLLKPLLPSFHFQFQFLQQRLKEFLAGHVSLESVSMWLFHHGHYDHRLQNLLQQLHPLLQLPLLMQILNYSQRVQQ